MIAAALALGACGDDGGGATPDAGAETEPDAAGAEPDAAGTEPDAAGDEAACVAEPAECDDGNSCTEDSCDPASGCDHSPMADGATCDDGDPSTRGDTCAAAACAGLPLEFAEGVVLTTDFTVGAGWSSVADYPRFFADADGDGDFDIIGFGNTGVVASLNDGGVYAPGDFLVNDLGAAAGYTGENSLRLVADVDGNQRADLIAIRDTTRVLLNFEDGFQAADLDFFGTASDWSHSDVRALVDRDGDGDLDLIGLGDEGVWLSTFEDGAFAAPVELSDEFSTSEWGQAIAGNNTRLIRDVDGDGTVDLVGFGAGGVFVAFGTAEGLEPAVQVSDDFASFPGGTWNGADHDRVLADVDGDGDLDIVGFGKATTEVSRQDAATRTFEAATTWSTDFNLLWARALHPRGAADLDGDGVADAYGFSDAGLHVALSDGSTFGSAPLIVPGVGLSHGWSRALHIRQLVDADGDGDLDLVAFGNAQVLLFEQL